MRFLRRSTEDAAVANPDGAATPAPVGGSGAVHTPGKGRPTPKRRDAEARKRGPAPPPPRTQREAMRQARANRGNKEDRQKSRDQRRSDAADRRARMMAGEEKYLMPRDKGPVRAHIRDLVDARPHLMGLFMPLAVLVLISALLPFPAIQQYLSLFCIVALVVMIAEGVFLGMTISRRARLKFPDADVRGLATGWYVFTRASQIRRLRVPKPRVGYRDNP